MKAIKSLLIIFIFSFTVFPAYAQETVHHLQQGETLYSLSRRYQVPLSEILAANIGISAEKLSIGEEIVIPFKKNLQNQETGRYNVINYIVKPGDTYYSVSRAHGMSVNELLALNGLSENNVLSIGQVLSVAGIRDSLDAGPVEQIIIVDQQDEAEEIPVRYQQNESGLFWPADGALSRLEGKLSGVAIELDSSAFVRAVAGGTVVWTGPYRGFGKVILIDTEDYIYLYGGNDDIFVNVGENVRTGDRIGRVEVPEYGSERQSVFFSVFKDGSPVDVNTAPRG